MDKHVTALGVLYIVFSALRIIAAITLYIVLIGVGLISEDPEAMQILATVGTVISFVLFFCSIPGIIGGIGLLNRQGWARILVIILGFLKLLNIPIGTALGIYTIWVLFNKETEKLFSAEKSKK